MTNEKAIHILMHLADHVEEIDGRIGIDGALMNAVLLAINALKRNCGHWVDLGIRLYGGGKQYTHYCSECGQHGYDEYKMCPNCGAQMICED